MKEIIIDPFLKIWPLLVLVLIIVFLTRITYLYVNKKKFRIMNEIMLLLFLLYIIFLAEIVTLEAFNYGIPNYIPFKEILRYKIGTDLFYKNTIGNIILFVPLGIFYSYFFKNKKFLLNLIIIATISLSIEGFQYVIGRTFDIDDIILNVFGGIIGLTIGKLFKGRRKYEF